MLVKTIFWCLVLSLSALSLAFCSGQVTGSFDPSMNSPGLVLAVVPTATVQDTTVQDTTVQDTTVQDTDEPAPELQEAGGAQSVGSAKGGVSEVKEKPAESKKKKPLVTNDAVIFGMLAMILGVVFWTSGSQIPSFTKFYKVVPMLLMCYFLPSLLTLAGIVDPESSQLYKVVSRYLLPASLVLLTISIDFGAILRLGPKALIMFLTGTVGVVLGGPLAVFITMAVAPDLIIHEGSDATWRGLSTVAGSWIGGGANQAAMKEVFLPSDALYSQMVAVDIIVAELWMFLLLLGVGRAKEIDQLTGADSSSIDQLQQKMETFAAKIARIPTTMDLMVMVGVAFGVTGLCHFAADIIGPWIGNSAPSLSKFSLDSQFFWLIVLSTTLGLLLSFTPMRNLEGAGASKVGTVFIFLLVATIGLNMDLHALVENPGIFAVGGIWMAFHVLLLVIVGIAIKAPYFYLAVGSKANIGGAASAPVVAAAFHPSLAPVGVLLAVLGYALGTYGAYLCALAMQWVSDR